MIETKLSSAKISLFKKKIKTLAPIVFLFFIFFNVIASNNIIDTEYTSARNDTIWVYDTIVVYDTVWVYDTVYIDCFPPLEKLDPIEVCNIELNNNTTELQWQYSNSATNRDQSQSFPTKEKTSRKKRKQNYSTGKNKRQQKHLSKSNFNALKSNQEGKSFILDNLDIELYGSPVFQKTEYQKDTINLSNDSLINSTSNLVSLKCGMHFTYRIKNFSMTTGAGILQYRENALCYETSSIPDTVNSTTQSFNSTNTYLFLEVPIIGGYHFQYPHTDFSIKLGAINQFHLKSKGKMNSAENTIEDINILDFTSYNLAIYGGIAGSYKLTKRWLVGAEAYYQYPLKKFATINKLSIYKQSYGVNLTLTCKLVARRKTPFEKY